MDYFDYFFAWLTSTYYGGFLCLLLAVIAIYFVKKYPDNSDNAWFAGDMKGWAATIGFSLLGLGIIISKLLGKL
jgi:hypothetical protein